MPITFTCQCGQVLEVPDAAGGKLAACPSCRQNVPVPASTWTVPEEKPIPRKPKSESSGSGPPPLPPPPPPQETRTEYYVPEMKGEPDFFCEAPKTIGRVLSAHTSLVEEMQPKTFGQRSLLAGMISGGIVAVVLVTTLVLHLSNRNLFSTDVLRFWLPLGCVVTVLLVFAIVFAATSFSHFCGYTGELGCAWFACGGDRDKLTKEQVFLYEDADDLRVQTTNHFYNGAYTQTSYNYAWTDRDNRQVFAIAGSHKSHNNPPPRIDQFHLAQEAEISWSVYLMNKVLGKLKTGGTWTFRLAGNNHIKLYTDALQLKLKGVTQDFRPNEIAEMEIKNGQISIKEPGARSGWFTESGIHHFAFAEVANARVFLLLMHHLFNIPITG